MTVLDNSPKQLEGDEQAAERFGLRVHTVLGDMSQLPFADASFDLIVHPISNCFVADVLPVWKEASRVLCMSGELLAGFINPVAFMFDDQALQRGELLARHKTPYSDLSHLTEEELQFYTDKSEPLCFGHSLEHQLAGQMRAGLAVVDLYEDGAQPHVAERTLSDLTPLYLATRAKKMF